MRKVLRLRVLLTITLLCMATAPFAEADVGHALYERWAGSGTADSMLTESSPPDYTELVTSSQWGVGDGDTLSDYRARITGWLIPPADGNYIFWIATDDNGRLWLSTDDDPANATLVASVSGWAAEDDWTKFPEQQSDPISLQGGKPYWFRGGYQEAGGGDHIQIAWASTEAGIGDHTIIQGQYLSDTIPDRAYGPDPADGAINVSIATELQWEAPSVYEPTGYDVWFGTDPNEISQVLSLTTDTFHDPNGPEVIGYDTTYYWRVDTYEPNDVGSFIHAGDLWSFTTEPRTPLILSQPQGIYVWAGETAIFTISGYSANSVPFTYEWFKEGEPGTILSDTDTLTIPDVQLADEGAYMCMLTNTYGDITSEPADLDMKQLIGHWPFNENADDIVGGNHGTVNRRIDYVEGIVDAYAVEFSNRGGIGGVDISAVPYTSPSWTISFWEKASLEESGEYEVLVGSGPSGWEVLDIGRWSMQIFYLGLNENEIYADLADAYPRGVWTNVTLTYDAEANLGTLYINSRPLIEISEVFTGFDPVLTLGDVSGYEYYGAIDDLRLYNFAMDPLEVFVLYADVTGETMCPQNPESDVSGPEGEPDCEVNIYDLVEVVANWLECNLFPVERCL